jgi:hypothetical protein
MNEFHRETSDAGRGFLLVGECVSSKTGLAGSGAQRIKRDKNVQPRFASGRGCSAP